MNKRRRYLAKRRRRFNERWGYLLRRGWKRGKGMLWHPSFRFDTVSTEALFGVDLATGTDFTVRR